MNTLQNVPLNNRILSQPSQSRSLAAAISLVLLLSLSPVALAEGEASMEAAPMESTSAPPPEPPPQQESGSSSTTNNNMTAENTGVAVNGNADNANVNNNQNTLTTGNNQNVNMLAPRVSSAPVVAPLIYSPTRGGSSQSVMVLPRNPLSLPNANLGRSNFGLQFGLQNNPGLGGFGGGGLGNALGWFMQGGVTIPFGKIPDVIAQQNGHKMDDVRQSNMERERMVFGNLQPHHGPSQPAKGLPAKTDVQGKVVGLGAYNLTTLPSAKISLPESTPAVGAEPVRLNPPKLLALSQAPVFTRPLNTGDKVGMVEIGNEYPYLGHTRSGWVKVLLPNGAEGWTSTHFEYIKNDFTEVDSLAVAPIYMKPDPARTAHIEKQKEKLKLVR
jgi:hypothetical protein